METWFLYAVLGAFFASLTTILAKIGIKNVDSHLATALRTVVVLVFAWGMVVIVGSIGEISEIEGRTWVFIVLSGLATGGSWLCYFRALKLGDVNKVVPIDKSSTLLTMTLAFIFLSEPLTIFTLFGMGLIALGTFLMLDLKKPGDEKERNYSWIVYAIMAAVFASLVSIIGRVGVVDIDASLWTALRTIVVVPLSFIMVFITKGHKKIKSINRKSWIFLVLSGMATGGAWLSFYHALQIGKASHVVPIDKLSIVLTMIFALLFLGEKFTKKSVLGLILLTTGTLFPIILF